MINGGGRLLAAARNSVGGGLDLSVLSRFHENRFEGRNSGVLSIAMVRLTREISNKSSGRRDKIDLLITTALRTAAVGAAVLVCPA
jgi:hypothetical protein